MTNLIETSKMIERSGFVKAQIYSMAFKTPATNAGDPIIDKDKSVLNRKE